MTTICLDVGNTRLKAGIFSPNVEPLFLTYEKYGVPTFVELEAKYPNSQIVLSSTQILPPEIEDYLFENTRYLRVSFETKLPFTNQYQTPHTLGVDRMALAASALSLYPNQNCLIIDAGTCITLDFIDAQGNYWGGSIHPGIEMRLKALHNFTGKLPLVKSGYEKNWVGMSTESCMRVGTTNAAVKEIESFIDDYERKYGKITILLCGGDSEVFFYNIKKEIFAHPNLVLIGLQKIAQYNAK